MLYNYVQYIQTFTLLDLCHTCINGLRTCKNITLRNLSPMIITYKTKLCNMNFYHNKWHGDKTSIIMNRIEYGGLPLCVL